jgi:ubiquinone/menaquinone biosynthesis C-methylase UbiE
MKILNKIGMQFKKPTGFAGKIISNIMIKGNKHEYITLINDFNIQPNDKLLEIGYGPGIGIELISKKFQSCNIYGIDFSELMFNRASDRNKQFIEKNRVHLQFGDFLDTEINESNFNKIFCLNVVYFWDDLQKPFKKINSLLKDVGIFYFFMAKKEQLSKIKFAKDEIFNKYSIEQVTDDLKSAGFNEVDYFEKIGYYIKAKK